MYIGVAAAGWGGLPLGAVGALGASRLRGGLRLGWLSCVQELLLLLLLPPLLLLLPLPPTVAAPLIPASRRTRFRGFHVL
jgi:hypothetical protein